MPPETEPWEQVDRAAAVRRERRREIELLVLGTVAVVAVLVVRFAPADGGDRIAFVVVGAVTLTAVVAATVWFVAGVRAGRTDKYRAVYRGVRATAVRPQHRRTALAGRTPGPPRDAA
jgi:hypothetical protein